MWSIVAMRRAWPKGGSNVVATVVAHPRFVVADIADAATMTGSSVGTCMPSRSETSIDPVYASAMPKPSAKKIASILASSHVFASSRQKAVSRKRCFWLSG